MLHWVAFGIKEPEHQIAFALLDRGVDTLKGPQTRSGAPPFRLMCPTGVQRGSRESPGRWA
jgi:hypothetical protein